MQYKFEFKPNTFKTKVRRKFRTSKNQLSNNNNNYAHIYNHNNNNDDDIKQESQLLVYKNSVIQYIDMLHNTKYFYKQNTLVDLLVKTYLYKFKRKYTLKNVLNMLITFYISGFINANNQITFIKNNIVFIDYNTYFFKTNILLIRIVNIVDIMNLYVKADKQVNIHVNQVIEYNNKNNDNNEISNQCFIYNNNSNEILKINDYKYEKSQYNNCDSNKYDNTTYISKDNTKYTVSKDQVDVENNDYNSVKINNQVDVTNNNINDQKDNNDNVDSIHIVNRNQVDEENSNHNSNQGDVTNSLSKDQKDNNDNVGSIHNYSNNNKNGYDNNFHINIFNSEQSNSNTKNQSVDKNIKDLAMKQIIKNAINHKNDSNFNNNKL